MYLFREFVQKAAFGERILLDPSYLFPNSDAFRRNRVIHTACSGRPIIPCMFVEHTYYFWAFYPLTTPGPVRGCHVQTNYDLTCPLPV